MSTQPEYSVVVPVYNSSASVRELVARLQPVFAGLGATYEVILVDDASPDPATWSTLSLLAAEHPEVHALQLARNFGAPGALLCGLHEARGTRIITMDDDLQHRPEDIPLLVAAGDHDAVIARFPVKSHGLRKRLASWIKGQFDHAVLGKPRHLANSTFRLLSRGTVAAMLAIRTPYPLPVALLYAVTRDVVNVDAVHCPRQHGHSGYGLWRSLRLFSNLIINNSSLILTAVAGLGLAMSLISFGLGVAVVFKKLYWGIAVDGWASLMLAILVCNGLVLFALGVIGEYLLRIINGVESKPAFVVRRRAGPVHG